MSYDDDDDDLYFVWNYDWEEHISCIRRMF